MNSKIVLLLVISHYFIFSCGVSHKIKNEIDTDSDMMKACEQYILNYTPLYVYNGDTTSIAHFNLVPENINNYLINCAKNNDFRPLKYSAALIIQQQREYMKPNNQECMIMDAMIQKNGFIVLIRHAMKIGNVEDDILDMNYFTSFSGGVCKWINDHKTIIDDFKFVEKQMRKRI